MFCVCHMMILKDSFTSNLPATCPCAPAAKEADPILGLRKSAASRSREAILPLCSALLRPLTGYWARFWASQYERDVEPLERAQGRATKVIKGLEHLFCEERRRGGTLQPRGEGARWRTDTVCFQWCPGAGQKATGTS